MQTTEKRHWQNGHQIRGGWFHTYNASFLQLGLMISWGKKLQIQFFKLI